MSNLLKINHERTFQFVGQLQDLIREAFEEVNSNAADSNGSVTYDRIKKFISSEYEAAEAKKKDDGSMD